MKIKKNQAIALFTLCAFIIDSTSAQGFMSVAPAAPSVQELVIPQGSLDVPDDLGSIQGRFEKQADAPFVIYIHDAHNVTDAQLNIEKLIQHFNQKYGIDLIALEGTRGKLDPTILRSFPDEFIKRQVVQNYLERGELGGPELAAILGNKSLIYEGIEDWPLYEKNYAAYMATLKIRGNILKRLEALGGDLDEQRKKTYSKELNTFHEAMTAFQEEKSGLVEVMKAILRVTGTTVPVTLSDKYPQISALAASVQSGEKLQIQQGNTDVLLKRIAGSFRSLHLRKLSLRSQKEFNLQYQSYITGQTDGPAFLKVLETLSAEAGAKIKINDLMRQMLGHSETLSTIKGTKLFDELEALFREIQSQLAKSAEAKELVNQYRMLRTLKDLIQLQWTREELDEYSGNAEAHLDFLGPPWRQEILPALEFYRLAMERDRAFHKNLLEVMRKNKRKAAIVLTGGFHAKGFEASLKEQGISYTVVMPRMNSLSGHEQYETIMRGQVSYRRYFKTTFYDAFMRHATEQLVGGLGQPDFRRNLKFWRDSILRQLGSENRMGKASEYTAYVDFLIKNYADKFSSFNEADLSKEAVVKSMETGLDSLRENMLSAMKARFEIQLEKFAQGLQVLQQRGPLNQQNLDQLLNDVETGVPSVLVPLHAVTLTPDISLQASSDMQATLDGKRNFAFTVTADPQNISSAQLVEQTLADLVESPTVPSEILQAGRAAASVVAPLLERRDDLVRQLVADIPEVDQASPASKAELKNQLRTEIQTQNPEMTETEVTGALKVALRELAVRSEQRSINTSDGRDEDLQILDRGPNPTGPTPTLLDPTAETAIGMNAASDSDELPVDASELDPKYAARVLAQAEPVSAGTKPSQLRRRDIRFIYVPSKESIGDNADEETTRAFDKEILDEFLAQNGYSAMKDFQAAGFKKYDKKAKNRDGILTVRVAIEGNARVYTFTGFVNGERRIFKLKFTQNRDGTPNFEWSNFSKLGYTPRGISFNGLLDGLNKTYGIRKSKSGQKAVFPGTDPVTTLKGQSAVKENGKPVQVNGVEFIRLTDPVSKKSVIVLVKKIDADIRVETDEVADINNAISEVNQRAGGEKRLLRDDLTDEDLLEFTYGEKQYLIHIFRPEDSLPNPAKTVKILQPVIEADATSVDEAADAAASETDTAEADFFKTLLDETDSPAAETSDEPTAPGEGEGGTDLPDRIREQVEPDADSAKVPEPNTPIQARTQPSFISLVWSVIKNLGAYLGAMLSRKKTPASIPDQLKRELKKMQPVFSGFGGAGKTAKDLNEKLAKSKVLPAHDLLILSALVTAGRLAQIKTIKNVSESISELDQLLKRKESDEEIEAAIGRWTKTRAYRAVKQAVERKKRFDISEFYLEQKKILDLMEGFDLTNTPAFRLRMSWIVFLDRLEKIPGLGRIIRFFRLRSMPEDFRNWLSDVMGEYHALLSGLYRNPASRDQIVEIAKILARIEVIREKLEGRFLVGLNNEDATIAKFRQEFPNIQTTINDAFSAASFPKVSNYKDKLPDFENRLRELEAKLKAIQKTKLSGLGKLDAKLGPRKRKTATSKAAAAESAAKSDATDTDKEYAAKLASALAKPAAKAASATPAVALQQNVAKPVTAPLSDEQTTIKSLLSGDIENFLAAALVNEFITIESNRPELDRIRARFEGWIQNPKTITREMAVSILQDLAFLEGAYQFRGRVEIDSPAGKRIKITNAILAIRKVIDDWGVTLPDQEVAAQLDAAKTIPVPDASVPVSENSSDAESVAADVAADLPEVISPTTGQRIVPPAVPNLNPPVAVGGDDDDEMLRILDNLTPAAASKIATPQPAAAATAAEPELLDPPTAIQELERTNTAKQAISVGDDFVEFYEAMIGIKAGILQATRTQRDVRGRSATFLTYSFADGKTIDDLNLAVSANSQEVPDDQPKLLRQKAIRESEMELLVKEKHREMAAQALLLSQEQLANPTPQQVKDFVVFLFSATTQERVTRAAQKNEASVKPTLLKIIGILLDWGEKGYLEKQTIPYQNAQSGDLYFNESGLLFVANPGQGKLLPVYYFGQNNDIALQVESDTAQVTVYRLPVPQPAAAKLVPPQAPRAEQRSLGAEGLTDIQRFTLVAPDAFTINELREILANDLATSSDSTTRAQETSPAITKFVRFLRNQGFQSLTISQDGVRPYQPIIQRLILKATQLPGGLRPGIGDEVVNTNTGTVRRIIADLGDGNVKIREQRAEGEGKEQVVPIETLVKASRDSRYEMNWLALRELKPVRSEARSFEQVKAARSEARPKNSTVIARSEATKQSPSSEIAAPANKQRARNDDEGAQTFNLNRLSLMPDRVTVTDADPQRMRVTADQNVEAADVAMVEANNWLLEQVTRDAENGMVIIKRLFEFRLEGVRATLYLSRALLTAQALALAPLARILDLVSGTAEASLAAASIAAEGVNFATVQGFLTRLSEQDFNNLAGEFSSGTELPNFDGVLFSYLNLDPAQIAEQIAALQKEFDNLAVAAQKGTDTKVLRKYPEVKQLLFDQGSLPIRENQVRNNGGIFQIMISPDTVIQSNRGGNWEKTGLVVPNQLFGELVKNIGFPAAIRVLRLLATPLRSEVAKNLDPKTGLPIVTSQAVASILKFVQAAAAERAAKAAA